MFDFFFAVLESLWGNENGWSEVSEEHCFMFLMWLLPYGESARVCTYSRVHTGMGVYDSKSWL